MKLGLYSITYLGVWYRGPALTIEQLIDRAREYGYAGIEIDGKRPHGNPLDMPVPRCHELRERAHLTSSSTRLVMTLWDRRSSPSPSRSSSSSPIV